MKERKRFDFKIAPDLLARARAVVKRSEIYSTLTAFVVAEVHRGVVREERAAKRNRKKTE